MILKTLEKKLSYKFEDRKLIDEALTHPTYAHEKKLSKDNQRLEFFGDAVIQIIVSEYLFGLYPDYQEGLLTRIRSSMTRAEALGELAAEIELEQYMYLGKGAQVANDKSMLTAISDCFEAVFGVIYLENGIDASRKVFLHLAIPLWPEPKNLLQNINPKGQLQEITQKLFNQRPQYEIIDIQGPEHVPVYTATVSVQEKIYGQGVAGNRKEAEEKAALEAIETLKK